MSDVFKIGEYVRTSNGEIGKIRAIIDNKIFINNNQYYHDRHNILKHSKNIIDLIEVGDFVNGKLIHKTDIRKDSAYIYYDNCKTFTDYQIRTILTKEQYNQNCYNVNN